MDINTKYSSTSGSPAAGATVLKRRTAQFDAPAPFALLADEPVQMQESAPDSKEKKAEVIISASEKQYFESLFPNSADAIRTYSPYQRNGMQQPAGLGRLVDVKG